MKRWIFDIVIFMGLSYSLVVITDIDVYTAFIFIGVGMCLGKLSYLQSKIDQLEK